MALNPVIQDALQAVELPEVKEIIRQLSKHGLAVALPHAHAEDGSLIPLPETLAIHEAGLKVSFVPKSSLDPTTELPVMWRWSEEAQAPAWCAGCPNILIHK